MMKNNHREQGWSSIEFLLTLPVLMTIFLFSFHFGMVMYTKIALQNATHAAAQIYGKTKDCSKAQQYFQANFNKPGTLPSCVEGSEQVEVHAVYIYNSAVLALFPVDPITLKSKSVAYKQKD